MALPCVKLSTMTAPSIRRVGATFMRGIAPLDGQALGFYRVCFAIGLWWVLQRPNDGQLVSPRRYASVERLTRGLGLGAV